MKVLVNAHVAGSSPAVSTRRADAAWLSLLSRVLGIQARLSRNFAIPAPRSLTRLRFLQVATTCLSDAFNLSPGYRGHSGPHRLPRLPATVGRSGLFWTVTGSTPSPGSGIWAEADWFSVPSGFEAHPPGPVSVYRPRVTCSNGRDPIGSPSPRSAAFTTTPRERRCRSKL